jgi:hypothetical protein
MTIDSSMSTPLCYGGDGYINTTVAGGNGPYTYTWSSSNNSNYNIEPSTAPSNVFTDKFFMGFEIGDGLNSSIICEGTGSYLDINYVPSRSGYCSLVSFPDSVNLTVFSVGCSSCIDTMKYSGMQFYINFENPEDYMYMKVGLFTYGASTSTLAPIFSLSDANATTSGWKKVVVDFSSATQDVSDTVNIKRNITGTVGRILVDDIVLLPKSISSTGTSVNAGFNSYIIGGAGTYYLTVSDINSCSVTDTYIMSQPTSMSFPSLLRNSTR